MEDLPSPAIPPPPFDGPGHNGRDADPLEEGLRVGSGQRK